MGLGSSVSGISILWKGAGLYKTGGKGFNNPNSFKTVFKEYKQ